jgi:hypothetical protein
MGKRNKHREMGPKETEAYFLSQQLKAARKFAECVPNPKADNAINRAMREGIADMSVKWYDAQVEAYVERYNLIADGLGEPHTTTQVIEPLLRETLIRNTP